MPLFEKNSIRSGLPGGIYAGKDLGTTMATNWRWRGKVRAAGKPTDKPNLVGFQIAPEAGQAALRQEAA